MGLSASQARFLQLTARKSNVEYQSQRINFERLQMATKLSDASSEYQDAMNNRKMMYAFNDGSGETKIDITYQNYKNYMNQQMEGLTTSQDKFYLVSSSGNKVLVSSEDEIQKMIDGSAVADEEGNLKPTLSAEDFMVVDGLDDPAVFQDSIQNGYYYFATREFDNSSNSYQFKTQGWDTLGGGAISEVYDTADDKAAEAKYEKIQTQIQAKDKKLELELNKLETERNAIQTEIDSVSKVIEDNVESSFKVFS